MQCHRAVLSIYSTFSALNCSVQTSPLDTFVCWCFILKLNAPVEVSLSAKWAWGVPQWQQQPRLHFTRYKAQCPERERWQVAKQKPKNSPTFLTNTSTEGTEVSLLLALAFSTGFICSVLLAQGTTTLSAHPCAPAGIFVAKPPSQRLGQTECLQQQTEWETIESTHLIKTLQLNYCLTQMVFQTWDWEDPDDRSCPTGLMLGWKADPSWKSSVFSMAWAAIF